jgi:hypothetical protein
MWPFLFGENRSGDAVWTFQRAKRALEHVAILERTILKPRVVENDPTKNRARPSAPADATPTLL